MGASRQLFHSASSLIFYIDFLFTFVQVAYEKDCNKRNQMDRRYMESMEIKVKFTLIFILVIYWNDNWLFMLPKMDNLMKIDWMYSSLTDSRWR